MHDSYTDRIFLEDVDLLSKLSKEEQALTRYTIGLYKTCNDEEILRSDAVLRNSEWKFEARKFVKETKSTTDDGKINNKFYRHKFKYDVVVPIEIYRTIMDYYFYTIEENIEEESRFISKHMDHIMTFCHVLQFYNGRYISNCFSKRDKTPLAAKLISSFIGKYYGKVTSFLERLGILDIDKSFLPAFMDQRPKDLQRGICRHYKFGMAVGSEFVVYQVTKRPIITKVYKILGNSEELDYASNSGNTIKDKDLNKWFSSHFDLDETVIDDRSKDFDGFNFYFSKVNNQKGKEEQRFQEFTIGRDIFGKRLYHPLLNLNKHLRNHIRIDGSMDKEIVDINNSHPYFFGLLFDHNFLAHVAHLLTETELEMFYEMSKDPSLDEKITLFRQITAGGNYYSFLKEHIKWSTNIKDTNMYYFYGRMNKRNAVYKLFANNFDFINTVKFKIIKQSGYKRLCQILQQVEAHVMIDTVFAGLKNDGYSIIPLHDAIMCRSENVDVVRNAIISAFKSIGVKMLPTFDKTAHVLDVKNAYEVVKEKNFNLFLNKGIMLDRMNQIIKAVGISNRVFKEGMKPGAAAYIDQRFESMRHDIDDDMANEYYDLRMRYDAEKFDMFDFSPIYKEYSESTILKRKFYAKDVVDLVKINPIEYFNHQNGTLFKTRLKENKYIY